jgi:hypothetical protein
MQAFSSVERVNLKWLKSTKSRYKKVISQFVTKKCFVQKEKDIQDQDPRSRLSAEPPSPRTPVQLED